jgi:hypothetical protein
MRPGAGGADGAGRPGVVGFFSLNTQKGHWMINRKLCNVIKEEHQFVSVECDRCKKVVTKEDPMELQEFFHWGTVGGYASVFGDSIEVECDLCQRCLYELIREYYRVRSYD